MLAIILIVGGCFLIYCRLKYKAQQRANQGRPTYTVRKPPTGGTNE